MSDTAEKLEALRAEMKAQGLDGFIIPRADECQGEFVAPYAERLKYLTGFTGSGGIAAVLQDKAIAMTDGRYLLQIAQQVDAQHFETGDMIKDKLENWLLEYAGEGAVIGYDPWLHTPSQIKQFEGKGLNMQPVQSNPLDDVWSDQPACPDKPTHDFPSSLAGQTAEEKQQKIVESLREKGADFCILSLPDSIGWLTNTRGHDTDYIPQKLGYALVSVEGSLVQGISAGDDLSGLKDKTVLLDHKRSPIGFKHALEKVGANITEGDDPCILPKAMKVSAEQEAIKKAHIVDGVALVKFFHWLDGRSGVSEVSAGEKLKEFRGEHPAFKGNSFPTIAGFGSNGAIIHYRATPETDKMLQEGSLFLLDSGGQYLDEVQGIAGTTDITRTIAIGQPSQEMREHFTLVLKGHIALAMAEFSPETTGVEIDALARGPLKEQGLDYAHGTGHGVGCYSAVHEEAATGISPRGKETFKPGMLLSNEPGYYKEGEYGIRIENLVFVKGESEMHFETISLAPIDRKLIIADMLDKAELEWLNTYHTQVFETLSPHLDGEELAWLEAQTAGID